jgi:hypothetical protein
MGSISSDAETNLPRCRDQSAMKRTAETQRLWKEGLLVEEGQPFRLFTIVAQHPFSDVGLQAIQH